VKVDAKEIDRRLKAFTLRLSEAGVKLTHQRLEIFREVAATAEHPDADEILKAVKPRLPTVSLDTVYRTMGLLAELGLVTTLGPRRQAVRFDANPKDHHHFVCDRCGLVRDFESAEFDRIQAPAAVRALGTAVRAQVEIRGICEKCSNSRGGNRGAKTTRRS
jgi:Fur family peroxide stress response transcriptional regulator